MNGDGLPDYVVARNPGWDDKSPRPWVVVLNEGDGWAREAIEWPGTETDYLSASSGDIYRDASRGLSSDNLELFFREGNELAGLLDINRDGLPDFVFSGEGLVHGKCRPAPPSPLDGTLGVDAVSSWFSTPGDTLCVQLNNGHGFEKPRDWWVDGVPSELLEAEPQHDGLHIPVPTLGTTRTHLEHSSTYNDGYGVELAGMRDWNGDGLLDYFRMVGGSGGALEDRTPVVWLNDGTGFRTATVDATTPYGRLDVDLSALDGLQATPPGIPSGNFSQAQVGINVARKHRRPGGPVAQTRFVDLNGDGALDLAQSIEPSTKNDPAIIRLFSLQSAVPDVVTAVWEPGGAHQAIEYAPARDFMDRPGAFSPVVPEGTLADSLPDAYPASSQVVASVVVRDGLGERGAPPLVTTFTYGEPRLVAASTSLTWGTGHLHPSFRRRSLGWSQVFASNGAAGLLNEYRTEDWAAGLIERSVTVDADGELYSETLTEWDHHPFFTNYAMDWRPESEFPFHNWHLAPVFSTTRTREPLSPTAELNAGSWTEYDPRNGLPVCSVTDPDGDGYGEVLNWTSYASAHLDDGKLDAVRAAGVATLPLGAFHRDDEHMCEGLPEPERGQSPPFGFATDPVMSSFRELYPSGRPQVVLEVDETGQAPDRRQSFGYYPNGSPFQQSVGGGPGAATSTTLLDPVIGAHAIESHAPATWSTSGAVEHRSEAAVCGLSGSQVGCTAASHGATAWGRASSGLESWVTYDDLGRPVATEDSIAQLGGGATTMTYWRARRRAGVSQTPDDAANLPATVASSTPFDEPVQGSRRTNALVYVDGLGREVLTAGDWIDETGQPGQRVGGWARRNAQGDTEVAFWPCFVPGATLTAPGDFDQVQPSELGHGLCGAPSPKETFIRDPLGRVIVQERPDATSVVTVRKLDAGFGGVEVTTTHTDGGSTVYSKTEELTAPSFRRTRRFGASAWEHDSTSGSLPSGLTQTMAPFAGSGGINLSSFVDTVEYVDALGRRTAVTRTGVPSGDETRFHWTGFGDLAAYEDPDQGLWEFAYDDQGRVTRRELMHPQFQFAVSATEWAYDAQGRVLEEASFGSAAFGGVPPEERWVWEYDVDRFGLGPQFGSVGQLGGGHVGQATSAEHYVADWCGTGTEQLDTVLEWSWDRRGRSTEASQTLLPCGWSGQAIQSAPTLVEQSRYAENGARTWWRSPIDGEEVVTELDDVGRGDAVWSPTSMRVYVASATFEIQGRPYSILNGNGVEQQFTYRTGDDNLNALDRSVVTNPSTGAVYFDREYDWDVAGNLVGWFEPDLTGDGSFGEEEMRCSYDGIGQLRQCISAPGTPDNAWYYRYDVLGSLIGEDVLTPLSERVASQYTRAGGLQAIGGVTAPLNAPVARVVDGLPGATGPAMSLAYDARGQVVAQRYHDGALATGAGAQVPEVSEAGLMESGGSALAYLVERSFDWKVNGRLDSVSVDAGSGPVEVSRYWYGPGGGRLAHRVSPSSGRWTEQRRLGAFELIEDDADGARVNKSVFLGGRKVAMVSADLNPGTGALSHEEVRWFGGDHLGSASVVTDAGGSLLRGVRYEPYGRIRDEVGPERATDDYEPGGVDELFNGKLRNRAAFGLAGGPFELEGYDYGARIYLPELGRWASADAITPDMVWEANPYAYVRNNPLKYVDPDGRAVETAVDAIDVGWTLYEFWRDPSLANAGWLAVSVVGAAVPFLPGAWAWKMGTHATRGLKYAGDVKSLDSFEQVAARFLHERGDDIVGMGDAGVRKVLGKTDSLAADFLSVTAGGRFRLAEVKAAKGKAGADVGHAIEQLSETADALRRKVPDAKVGLVELIIPKGGKLNDPVYQVVGDRLARVIDGQIEWVRVSDSIVHVVELAE